MKSREEKMRVITLDEKGNVLYATDYLSVHKKACVLKPHRYYLTKKEYRDVSGKIKLNYAQELERKGLLVYLTSYEVPYNK